MLTDVGTERQEQKFDHHKTFYYDIIIMTYLFESAQAQLACCNSSL